MRILLLGSEGQLARDLAIALSHHDLVLGSHRELEIRDDLAVKQAVSEIAPDCIINTAAYHRVDECEDRPELAFAVNAAGVLQSCARCTGERRQARPLQHRLRLRRQKALSLHRSRPPQPALGLRLSKWAGERLIERYCEKHYLIRACGLYGAGGSASKGGNFVRSILRAAEQGKPLRVVADQIVTPTSTVDLAEKVTLLLEHESYGLYHMTNTGECSWFDFAKEALRLAGHSAEITPVTSVEYGAKAQRPAYSVLDNTRMRALGIEEFRPWQSALADFIGEEQCTFARQLKPLLGRDAVPRRNAGRSTPGMPPTAHSPPTRDVLDTRRLSFPFLRRSSFPEPSPTHVGFSHCPCSSGGRVPAGLARIG